MRVPDRLVIDASVVVKLVLPENGAAQVRRLFDLRAREEVQLRAPDVVVAEAANAIWKRCRLRRELSEDDSRRALADLLADLPDLVPSTALISQAFEIALAFRRPVYDCLYVALAEREGCPLVTADVPLIRSVGPATGRVLALDAFDLG